MGDLALSALSLSHFRSYHRLDLDIPPGPVALFGPNGAGKTNLLEAISLLSPGRGLRRARASDISRDPENLGWRLTAQLTSHGQPNKIVTGLDDPTSARKVTINGKAASQVALGRLARILWLVPVMDRLWLEGAGDRRNFLDRIAMSFAPDHADATVAYDKAMRERNRLLKDQVTDPSWYTALETQMAEQGSSIMAGRMAAVDRLRRAQSAAQSSFPAAELAIVPGNHDEALTSTEDLAQLFADGRGRDSAAGRTLAGPHRADLEAIYAAKNMPARLCSTGEQKALLVSLILANARALAEDFGAPPILLLDEVAAHLDVDRRTALFDEIVALGAQAFLSGTGQELFVELDDRAIRYKVTERDGRSQLEQL